MSNTHTHIDQLTAAAFTGKKTFGIVCRGSLLSLAQAEIFKQKVAAVFPDVTINTIIQETAGDKNQSTPLHLVEGKDFFTKAIQDFLRSGQADFAVHSMKDVSSEDFFNESHYVIIDREDIRDVAIFNEDIIDKIKAGKKIIMGTSSPRRTDMSVAFLQKALPQFNSATNVVEAIPIRGNVDTRLRKLSEDKQYDGIILAAAGLNRLLKFEPAKALVKGLLKNRKLMVLPLFDCPPAAGQGAIVAETTANNPDAIQLLEAIKDPQLTNAIKKERKYAQQYGYGCSQQFGAFHLDTEHLSFTYASGKDKAGKQFTSWDFETGLSLENKKLFSSTDFMKDFFAYNYLDANKISGISKAFFIATHKAVHSPAIQEILKTKQVWAAGTKTWLELAKKGIWVEGAADGLGLSFVLPALYGPLFNLEKKEIEILTNTSSARHWQQDGWAATGTYELLPVLSEVVKTEISEADIIFWTSFQQYQSCKAFIKSSVQHVCPPGKTATLLIAGGIQPIIFPGIKAFNEWRKKNTIVTSEG